MNKDLLKKLMEEEQLDLAQTVELDQALEAQGRSLVSSLETPEPSMAWRSGLNERLAELAPKPKRKWAIFSGTTVVAVAAALVIVMVQPVRDTPPPAAQEDELEMALAQAHGDAEATARAGVLVPDWGG
ncbi:MAG: hypothetical protein AB7F50_01115 [Fimbriimonadaceae bacterium]